MRWLVLIPVYLMFAMMIWSMLVSAFVYGEKKEEE